MRGIKSKLRKYLKKKDTFERCGLILNDGIVLEALNMHETPETGFRIRGETLAEFEDQLYGTWHTHPHGSANLSEQDYIGFRNWPRLRHYIVGKDGIRCFEVQDNFVVEVKN